MTPPLLEALLAASPRFDAYLVLQEIVLGQASELDDAFEGTWDQAFVHAEELLPFGAGTGDDGMWCLWADSESPGSDPPVIFVWRDRESDFVAPRLSRFLRRLAIPSPIRGHAEGDLEEWAARSGRTVDPLWRTSLAHYLTFAARHGLLPDRELRREVENGWWGGDEVHRAAEARFDEWWDRNTPW